MTSFAELAASRREWIDQILKPWCLEASQSDLKCAAEEWHNIAGRVDVNATLWTWAWSRFPVLVHDQLSGVNETAMVTVTRHDGTTLTGFPDSRKSEQGNLVLFSQNETTGEFKECEPVSIDDIATVIQAETP